MAESNDKQRKRRGPRKATATYLENAALYYLQRFSSSAANLRRVMIRKVEKSAHCHGTEPDEGAALVDAMIERYLSSGLLDDAVYASGRTRALHRRGASARSIRATLRGKGVAGSIIDDALAGLAQDGGDPELVAAARLARRRRLGPYRTGDEREKRREKDLAALARAGFSYGTARRVIESLSVEELEDEVGG
jgi:regulatory protein